MMGTPRSNNRAALSDNLRRIFALMSDTPCRRPWPLSVIVELVERNSRLAGTIYEGCSKESERNDEQRSDSSLMFNVEKCAHESHHHQ
jgi:hypothetical protein